MANIPTAKSRLGALERHRGPNDPATLDARRDLRAAVLEERARAAVAEFPPLTDEQVGRIVSLLRGGGRVA